MKLKTLRIESKRRGLGKSHLWSKFSNLIIINQMSKCQAFKSLAHNSLLLLNKTQMDSQQTLKDILPQLEAVLQQEGLQHSTHRLLSLLTHHSSRLLQHHSALEEQLVQKTTEAKQLTKRLKSTKSKLEQKAEECTHLKDELQRVTQTHGRKVQQLLKQQDTTNKDETLKKKEKQKLLKASGSQCDLLDQVHFKELSVQATVLKKRLQETQESLLQEKALTRALNSKLEEITLSEEAETEDVKDNSTIDADSLRGDPWDVEQSWDWEQEETVLETKPQEEKPERSWWRQAWHRTQKLYQTIINKK